MERITAGSGGDITNISGNVTEYKSNGGSVYGIYVTDLEYPAYRFVDATELTFSDIRAGNGGNFSDGQYCSGGEAELLQCFGVYCNIQLGVVHRNNVQHGQGCRDDATTTSSTTEGVTTTTDSTTGETSTTGESSTTDPTGTIIALTTSGTSTTGSTTDSTTDSTTTTTDSTTTGQSTSEATTSTSSTSTTSSSASTTSSSTTSSSTTSSSTSTTSSTSSSTSSTTGANGVPPTLQGVRFNKTRTSVTVFWNIPEVIITITRNTMETYRSLVDVSSSYPYNWTTKYNGYNTNYTITGLTPNTLYFVRVAAVSGTGTVGEYVQLNITTANLTIPSQPNKPGYSSLGRENINLVWTAPEDDGGLPITLYTLEKFQNQSWVSIFSNLSLSYQHRVRSERFSVWGLNESRSYEFRLSASNSLGVSNFSPNVSISTAFPYCGDGICDGGDTCNNCYLDCGTCGYLSCPGSPECSGRGSCDKGVCSCSSGWGGSSCNIQTSSPPPVVIAVNTTVPSVTVDLDPINAGGSASDHVKFTVSFLGINEVTPAAVVESYLFSNQTFNVSQNIIQSGIETVYIAVLPNKASVVISISVFSEDSSVAFANQSIQVSKNGVKYAMEIFNWPFKSLNNKMVVTIESNGQVENDNGDNECSSIAKGVDESDSLRWFLFNINGVVLYGKFAEYALIDGKIRTVQFSYNTQTDLIEVSIPHFWENAAFDPDFSVLYDKESQEAECNSAIKNGDSMTSGKIAGITVGVVVGAAAVVGAGLLAHKINEKRKLQKRLDYSNNRKSKSYEMAPSSGLETVSSSSPLYNSNKSAVNNSSPLYNSNDHENPLYSS